MPINLPQIDVLCIGAGGGSIARVDAVRLAAPSARPAPAPSPGPAAYGLGGEDATVTDAHVVLGTLSSRARAWPAACRSTASWPRGPSRRVGGRAARPGASRRPPRRSCASPTPTWPTRCGVMSVARGHDPRRFALVAIGGAGPDARLRARRRAGHPARRRARATRASPRRSACWPPTSATTCAAAGCGRPPTSRRRELDAELARLEAEAARAAGARRRGHRRSFELAYELDMRYRGQAYNLTVPLRRRGRSRPRRSPPPSAAFEAEHRARSTTTRRASPRPRS